MQLHHTMQRMLKPYEVEVPFADRLGAIMPCDVAQSRRTFDRLISTVCTCTLLHQFQREHKPGGIIVATRDDFNMIRPYIKASMCRELSVALSKAEKDLIEYLRSQYGFDQAFTIPELKENYGGTSTIHRHINKLRGRKIIEKVKGSRSREAAQYRLSKCGLEKHGVILPRLGQKRVKLKVS